jgi:hypothetical protein
MVICGIAMMSVSCGPLFPPPREKIDWRTEWQKHGEDLKRLTREIKTNVDGKYKVGNNNFPENFKYPFDEGFVIDLGRHNVSYDTNTISITYYFDRGLLDHFGAFVYAKDSAKLTGENKVKVKLEQNWYVVIN